MRYPCRCARLDEQGVFISAHTPQSLTLHLDFDTQPCFRDLGNITGDHNVEKRTLDSADKFKPCDPRRCFGNADVAFCIGDTRVTFAAALDRLAVSAGDLGLAEDIIRPAADKVFAFDG